MWRYDLQLCSYVCSKNKQLKDNLLLFEHISITYTRLRELLTSTNVLYVASTENMCMQGKKLGPLSSRLAGGEITTPTQQGKSVFNHANVVSVLFLPALLKLMTRFEHEKQCVDSHAVCTLIASKMAHFA
jgi:hypothetical protein